MSSPTAAATETLSAAERFIDWSWRLSLAAKAALAVTQTAGGIALWLAPSGAARRLVDWMVRSELAEDPADPVAAKVIGWAQHLSPAAEQAYTAYLIGHGLLHIAIVAGLMTGRRWASDAALAVIWCFVLYQLWQFARLHDPALLILTAVDLAVIALALAERRLTRRRATGKPGN